jgi:antitoxin VapB
MAIQIADSMITDKVDRVAKATGLSMTAVVELALDLWLSEMSGASDQSKHMAARIAQLDGTPYRAGSSEPIN